MAQLTNALEGDIKDFLAQDYPKWTKTFYDFRKRRVVLSSSDIAYKTPSTVEAACSEWADHPGAFYLAGATDLLPQVRLGRHTPSVLVDLKRIQALGEIQERSDGSLVVGAAVSLAQVATHPKMKEHYPLLVDCCLSVGSYPLRNRATLAGNICNASPAADTAAALLALEAAVEVASKGGSRTVPIGKFFKGPGKSALEPGELVTQIVLPKESAGCTGRYLRLARRRGVDLATVGVLVGRMGSGEPRVSLVAVAPTPLRVKEAEAVLRREGFGEEAADKAAQAAEAAASPIDDVRGTAQYRKEMVAVLTARGVRALADEAEEG